MKIDIIERKRSEALLEMEDQKLYASPSEREMIDQEIKRLDEKYKAQLEELKKLKSDGWTELGSEAKLVAALDTKGLKITKSGRILTKKGKILTVEEADSMGMFDDLDLPWEKIKDGLAAFDIKGKEEEEAADETGAVTVVDEEAGKN